LASEIHGYFSLQVVVTINGLALGLPALGSVGDIPLEVFLSHQIAGDNSEEEARNTVIVRIKRKRLMPVLKFVSGLQIR
jgi:hypothetical protein